MIRKFLKLSALIGAIIVLVMLIAEGLLRWAYWEDVKQRRATFFVDIDIASLGTIERMNYSICGEKTSVEPYEEQPTDGRVLWTANIATPEQLQPLEGIPCPVEILVTKDGKTRSYPADQLFDCPDCSGTHYYKIRGRKALYTYLP